jgi:hypothetical protein
MFQIAALLSNSKDKMNFDPIFGYWLTHQSEYSGRSKVLDCNTRNHHFDPWGGHELKDRGITLGNIFPKLPWFYGRPPAFDWDFNQRLTWEFDTGQGGEYIPIEKVASPPFLIQGYFFNSLYWHFHHRHTDKLANNPRIGMVYNLWKKMDTEKKEALLEQAEYYLENINSL